METDHQLKVTFFPPLHHQRRIWILDILRRERLTEIVDMGCGEGDLLAALCQPAPWMGPKRLEDDDEELSTLFCEVGLSDGDTPDLHATCITGLDISTSQLELAVQCTSPTSVNPMYTRWEPLNVQLWQGSVDTVNPAFVNAQCIVASELIEHLMDDVLVQVAPIILGVYQPRLFLVTTPSYTFNQRWSPPGETDPQGFPDPSGRTDRVFRHPDHKFEWTVDEFAQWCKDAAQQWGYVVETTTVGIPKEQDPWRRDEISGGATQVACFRRLDDHFSKTARDHGAQDVRGAIREPHKLVARQLHEAHPQAGCPSDLHEIEEAITFKFQYWGEMTLGVQELWFTDELPLLCGGSIEVMLNTAEQSTKLELQRVAGEPRGNWKIQRVGELTVRSPVHITPMETENFMCEDDELDRNEEAGLVDSGVFLGMTYNDTVWHSEDVDWAKVGGDGEGWAMSWNAS